MPIHVPTGPSVSRSVTANLLVASPDTPPGWVALRILAVASAAGHRRTPTLSPLPHDTIDHTGYDIKSSMAAPDRRYSAL